MADGPMPLLGFTFLQDCEGEMVFRGEGWSLEESKVSVRGQRNSGVPSRFLRSAPRCSLAGRARPPQTAGPDTLPPSFQAPGRKTTKERKKIYIYI